MDRGRAAWVFHADRSPLQARLAHLHTQTHDTHQPESIQAYLGTEILVSQIPCIKKRK